MTSKIRRLLQVASAAFFVACTPALAQWQAPNHSIPLGRGSGVTGFGSLAPCNSGIPILGTGASTDPICGALDLSGSGVTNILPVARFATGTPTGTKFVRDDGVLAVPAAAGAVLITGTILAKTANYTAVSADCNDTLLLSGGQFTLTLNAASGYAPNCGYLITNAASEIRSKTIAPNGLTSFFLYPGQSVVISNQNNVWTLGPIAGRWRPTSSVTFFIRPDGSDSNDGLANSAAGAFLTANACMNNLATKVDLNGQSVGCQHTCAAPPCNITAAAQMLGLVGASFVGGAPFYVGDVATPSNVRLTPSTPIGANIQIVFPTGGGVVNIGGFELAGGVNANHGVYASGGGAVNIGSPMIFDAISSAPAGGWPSGCGITANSGGRVFLNATLFYTANIGSALCIMNGAFMENGGAVTVNTAGTPAWGNGFVTAKWNGTADLTLTFTGTGATGNRCNINYGGTIYTNGGGATFFPGNVDCSTAAGTVGDAAGNRGNYN